MLDLKKKKVKLSISVFFVCGPMDVLHEDPPPESRHFLPHFIELQDGTCILLIKYLFINPSSFKYKLPGANFATLVNIYR